MKGGKCCLGWKLLCILLVVGGLNWGLVGLSMWISGDMSWNVVHMLLQKWMWLEALIYVLVGLAALGKLFGGCRCASCKGGTCAPEK